MLPHLKLALLQFITRQPGQRCHSIQSDLTEAGDAAFYDRSKGQDGSLLWVGIEGSADNDDHALLVETYSLPKAEVRDRHPPTFVGDREWFRRAIRHSIAYLTRITATGVGVCSEAWPETPET